MVCVLCVNGKKKPACVSLVFLCVIADVKVQVIIGKNKALKGDFNV